MVVNKNRDLNAILHCVYLSGGTEVDFNFEEYDYAIMHVKQKPDSNNVILALSNIVTPKTIELLPEGRIKFVATPSVMNVRSGSYVYDLYLYNDEFPKRAFMSGAFIIQDTVTN
jgi:hypothetical protein